MQKSGGLPRLSALVAAFPLSCASAGSPTADAPAGGTEVALSDPAPSAGEANAVIGDVAEPTPAGAADDIPPDSHLDLLMGDTSDTAFSKINALSPSGLYFVKDMPEWTGDIHGGPFAYWGLLQSTGAQIGGLVRSLAWSSHHHVLASLLVPRDTDCGHDHGTYVFFGDDRFVFSTVSTAVYDLGLIFNIDPTLRRGLALFDAITPLAVTGAAWNGQPMPTVAAVFGPDSQHLRQVFVDGSAAIWVAPALGGPEQTFLPGPQMQALQPSISVAIVATGTAAFRTAAVGKNSNSVFLWDFSASGAVETQAGLGSVCGAEAISQLALHPFDPNVLAVGTPSRAMVVELGEDRAPLGAVGLSGLPVGPSKLQFSADGRYLNAWLVHRYGGDSFSPEHWVFPQGGGSARVRVRAEGVGSFPVDPSGVLHAKIDSNRLGLWTLRAASGAGTF